MNKGCQKCEHCPTSDDFASFVECSVPCEDDSEVCLRCPYRENCRCFQPDLFDLIYKKNVLESDNN